MEDSFNITLPSPLTAIKARVQRCLELLQIRLGVERQQPFDAPLDWIEGGGLVNFLRAAETNRIDMFDTVDLSLARGYVGNLRWLVRKIRGADKWPSTMARIVSCERIVEETGAHGDTVYYEVHFTYSVQGITHPGKFRLPAYGTARLFAKGDEATIQFNPRNPEQTVYSEAWADGEPFWLTVLAACTLFLAHWLITGHIWFSSSSPE